MKLVIEEYPENNFYRVLRIFKRVRIKKVLLLIFGITILPAVILFINIIAFTCTKYLILEKNLALSKTYFNLIFKTSQVSDGLLYYYTKTPLVRGIYHQLYPFSQALTRSSDIGIEKIETSLLIDHILESSLKKENYDINEEGGKIVLAIGDILQKEDFQKAENKTLENSYLMRRFVSEEFLNIYPDTNLLNKVKNLAGKIGNMLGGSEERNYALLFENQNTIRPSGGVITSVAIISFQKGNLVDVAFYSPDEIDKRLVGVVEPPYPLNSSASKWQFKDANWGSDFVSESKDAKWFLEKALETKINGLVFVNQNVIDKKALEDQIKNFLELSPLQKLKKINDLFQNNNKTLLVYMEKDDELSIFEKLGLSNYVFDTKCSGCFQDFLGIIESDLKGNEYNNLIERKAELEISLEGKIIKKKLTLLLKRIKEEKTRYQIYLRFIAPPETSFSPAVIDGKKYLGRVEDADKYKQLEILVDIGERDLEKTIYLELEGISADNTSFNNYTFDWISQPGVLNFYSRLTFQPHMTEGFNIVSNESLTKSAEGVYNTNLAPFNKDIQLYLYF
jgi:hypothetical protein